jgi:hypothetical protein
MRLVATTLGVALLGSCAPERRQGPDSASVAHHLMITLSSAERGASELSVRLANHTSANVGFYAEFVVGSSSGRWHQANATLEVVRGREFRLDAKCQIRRVPPDPPIVLHVGQVLETTLSVRCYTVDIPGTYQVRLRYKADGTLFSGHSAPEAPMFVGELVSNWVAVEVMNDPPISQPD